MVKVLNSALIIFLVCIVIGIINKSIPHRIESTYISDIPTVSVPEFTVNNSLKDSIKILVGKRDPFLGKNIKKEKLKTSLIPKANPERKTKKVLEKQIAWPEILYLGFVRKSGSSRTVLLRVDEKLYKKKINDTLRGLKILKVEKDSILISLAGNKKYFIKK